MISRFNRGDESVADEGKRHSDQQGHQHRNYIGCNHKVVVVSNKHEEREYKTDGQHGKGVADDAALLFVLFHATNKFNGIRTQ